MNVNSDKRTSYNNNGYFTDRGSCAESPLLLGKVVFPIPANLPAVWKPVEQELHTVFMRLGAVLRPVGRSILKELMQRSFDNEFLLPPGLTLFSGRPFPKGRDQYLPAVTMELLYLAARNHNIAGRIKGKEQQSFVLAGDLLYSHLIDLLVKSPHIFLLENISLLITAMNEGFSSEEGCRLKGAKPGKKEAGEFIRKQYGVFYGESCFLGSLFAGANEKEQSLMREFGAAFGMAYGLRRKGYDLPSADDFLDKGLAALSLLPDSQGREDLKSFVLGIIAGNG